MIDMQHGLSGLTHYMKIGVSLCICIPPATSLIFYVYFRFRRQVPNGDKWHAQFLS